MSMYVLKNRLWILLFSTLCVGCLLAHSNRPIKYLLTMETALSDKNMWFLMDKDWDTCFYVEALHRCNLLHFQEILEFAPRITKIFVDSPAIWINLKFGVETKGTVIFRKKMSGPEVVVKKLHICPQRGIIGETGPLLHHSSAVVEQHESKSDAQKYKGIGQSTYQMK